MHSYVLCDAFTLLKVYKKESFQSFCETGKVSQTMAISYVSLPLLQIISMDLKSHRSCNYVLRLNLRQPLGTEITFVSIFDLRHLDTYLLLYRVLDALFI